MKTITLLSAVAVSFLFAGCWTVSETDYPDVSVAKLPAGKKLAVSLAGFDIDIYRYVPVEGHEQMTVAEDDRTDGPCVKENSSTNVYYATRNTVSRKLVDRASVGLERKGFDVVNANPQFVVSLSFTGPVERDYDVLKQLGMMICTLFTAEKNAESWQANVKVYDCASQKVVFEKSYEQDYTVTVWGPIPVASPACCEKISCTAASSWALTALTDRAVADASAFLADSAKK